jgi:phage gpG-like protein
MPGLPRIPMGGRIPTGASAAARAGNTPFRFTMTAFGVNLVDRMLLRKGQHVLEMELLLESLAEDLMNIEFDRFNSGGHSPFGGDGWAELAESTIRAKGHDQILVDTELLMRSLSERGADGQILDITPEGFRFGTEVPYGLYHQHGTVNMPARPILEFNEFGRQMMVKKIQLFIMRGEIAAL